MNKLQGIEVDGWVRSILHELDLILSSKEIELTHFLKPLSHWLNQPRTFDFQGGLDNQTQKISSYGTNTWNIFIRYTPFEIILKRCANESPFSSKMLGIYFTNTISKTTKWHPLTEWPSLLAISRLPGVNIKQHLYLNLTIVMHFARFSFTHTKGSPKFLSISKKIEWRFKQINETASKKGCLDVTSPSSRLSKGCASKHGCDDCPMFGMCFGCLFRLPIEGESSFPFGQWGQMAIKLPSGPCTTKGLSF